MSKSVDEQKLFSSRCHGTALAARQVLSQLFGSKDSEADTFSIEAGGK